MTRQIILKGTVKTMPTMDGNNCGFFVGSMPIKVYSPTLVESVMKYIRKGMTVRMACRLSDIFCIAEHIEIHH